jgi:hypothetical protein
MSLRWRRAVQQPSLEFPVDPLARRPCHGLSPQLQRKRLASLQAFDDAGAGTRIRTGDLLITNQLLYQLSYAGEGEGF